MKNIAPGLASLARPIRLLSPDPKNARLHPEDNLRDIEASLKSHGQQKPIVVLKGVVIAGNGTLEAAKRLGWTEIACVEYDGTEAQAKAYALADNRASDRAAYDETILASTLRELDAEGLLEATGYDEGSFADCLAVADRVAQEADHNTETEAANEPQGVDSISVIGQRFKMEATRTCGIDIGPDACDALRRDWTKLAKKHDLELGPEALE